MPQTETTTTFREIYEQEKEDSVHRLRKVRVTCTDGFTMDLECLGSKDSVRKYLTSEESESESELGYRYVRFIDFLG